MPAAPATQPRPKIGIRVGQAHPVNQACVDRRTGNPGHRNEEDCPEVLYRKSRAGECLAQSLLGEFLGDFDPGVIGFPPACQSVVGFNRQRQVPRLDPDPGEQAIEDIRIFELVGPALLQRCRNLLLAEILPGKSACHSGNSHIEAFQGRGGVCLMNDAAPA
jgi:hypothetical protein